MWFSSSRFPGRWMHLQSLHSSEAYINFLLKSITSTLKNLFRCIWMVVSDSKSWMAQIMAWCLLGAKSYNLNQWWPRYMIPEPMMTAIYNAICPQCSFFHAIQYTIDHPYKIPQKAMHVDLTSVMLSRHWPNIGPSYIAVWISNHHRHIANASPDPIARFQLQLSEQWAHISVDPRLEDFKPLTYPVMTEIGMG